MELADGGLARVGGHPTSFTDLDRLRELPGEVALVTGGSSGIGLATAELLLQRGVAVVIGARDEVRGAVALERLRRSSDQVAFAPMDVGDSADVERAFRLAESRFGQVGILVNNAGMNVTGAIEATSAEAWERCIGTNLKGPFLCSREAIPRMRSRGGGCIVNVASNGGLIARAADPVYCASKAGLVMFTRCLALAHAKDRIRVNAVCPGPVGDTEMIARLIAAAPDSNVEAKALVSASPMAATLGRMISPYEVAELIIYLCSNLATMITGAAIAIDGGKSAGIAR